MFCRCHCQEQGSDPFFGSSAPFHSWLRGACVSRAEASESRDFPTAECTRATETSLPLHEPRAQDPASLLERSMCRLWCFHSTLRLQPLRPTTSCTSPARPGLRRILDRVTALSPTLQGLGRLPPVPPLALGGGPGQLRRMGAGPARRLQPGSVPRPASAWLSARTVCRPVRAKGGVI